MAFRVPLRQRFRGVDSRAGVLVHGPAGWAEFSPFDDYGPEYSARWLAAAVEAATEPPPRARRQTIAVNTTVPAVAPEVAFDLVRASGCSTAKVKVAESGQQLADDVARIAAVRDALGADGHIRVDANGAWDVASAVLAIARLERAAGGLEYVEQPCRRVDELADVRRRCTVPIAADESIRTSDDPERVVRLGAADIIVLKVQPMGGIRAALDVVERCGLPAVASSAVETSVGLAVGVAFAAALDAVPFACGLGTASLLATDVVDVPVAPVDGAVAVRAVAPSTARLHEVALVGADERHWRDRWQAAAAHASSAVQAALDDVVWGSEDG
ncbi:MAG: o-succinylbenzoate synthase [Nitriliruptoraceae bacterium]